jgi:hypothetical protein
MAKIWDGENENVIFAKMKSSENVEKTHRNPAIEMSHRRKQSKRSVKMNIIEEEAYRRNIRKSIKSAYRAHALRTFNGSFARTPRGAHRARIFARRAPYA